MSAVWISRESWQKVWSAIHNIRVRCSHTVKTPCVTVSGSGASARINIDLPGAIAAESAYDGPFAVSYDSETEKLKIKKGFRKCRKKKSAYQFIGHLIYSSPSVCNAR